MSDYMENKTRNRIILAITAGIILLAPMAAWATRADFLSIRQALVQTSSDKVDSAKMNTKASIPKDGSGGAFGYGVLTSDTIIVSTTHPGVLDSKTQNGNKDNPVFHNHYTQLDFPPNPHCGPNPEVVLNTLTFGSPGKLTVGGSNLVQSNLPKSFEGQTQTNTLIGPKVVSFELQPIFKNNDPNIQPPEAVCVTNIQPADNIVVR
jgi:hypothetical protein